MPDPQPPIKPTADETVENGPITNEPFSNGSGAGEQGASKYSPDYGPNYGREYGGPKGREPTRYGDWEKNGRCIDF